MNAYMISAGICIGVTARLLAKIVRPETDQMTLGVLFLAVASSAFFVLLSIGEAIKSKSR